MRKFIALSLLFFLTACSSTPATPTATPAPAQVVIVPDTPTPTVVPSPTATQTMQQALYPYTIEGLRKHKFQSGKISIRETLLTTDIFTRYLIEYPSDGLVITGVMQVPVTGTPPYPVIVMNHGFFSRTVYLSGDGTDRAAEFLNKHGYLTVSSDYRSWAEAETGESLYYSGLAIDVINLMNALPSVKQADAKRIGMWGHSMGGGATLKVLTIDKRVKAAVLYSSVSADFEDIIGRWGPGCLGDVFAGEVEYGCNSSDILPLTLPDDLLQAYFDSVTDPAMLKAVSPLYHLDYVTAPVQIVYGTEDGKTSSGTPPEWSRKMYEGFIEADRDAQLFAHDGEEHSFSPEGWYPFMERASQFFDRYVKP
ncbi:MAG: acetylxylan esterase [Anaerolineales bacterium]|nr:acetylxylan esterase [Anaerolineales bacterium]MBP6210493.1 acetylxylan esterase [Anaerolineales bacterium]MBP8164550.1 acetylxylan esterase [Anaerolineales bacterium]